MKLNSPWKALLWEELFVAGSIILAILICIGIYPLISFLGDSYLRFAFTEIDIFSYAISAITAFLIFLNIGNTGNMQNGFSRRVLRLPVPTYLPVAVSMITRMLLILIQAIFIRALLLSLIIHPLPLHLFIEHPLAYFKNFAEIHAQNGFPLASTMCIHGSIYLVLQTMSWLFDLSVPIGIFVSLLAGILFLVAYIMNHSLTYMGQISPIASLFQSHPIVILLILTLAAYLINLKVVKAIRCDTLSKYSLERFIPFYVVLSKSKQKLPLLFKRFSNRYIAQLWFELKQSHGLILPLWTCIFWILGIALLLLYLYINRYLKNYSGSIHLFSYSAIIWLILPHISLILAGIMWYLRVSRRIIREDKQKSYSLSWMPMLPIERVNVQGLILSLNLLLAMIIVWLIQFTGVYIMYRFYLSPGFETVQSALSTHTDTFHYFSSTIFWGLLVYIVGTTLISGTFVWIFISSPVNAILLIVLIFIALFVPSYLSFISIIYFSICFYLTFMFFVYLFLAFYNRILKVKEILLILAIYLFVFICLLPFQYGMDTILSASSGFIATYLGLTSMILIFWLKSLLRAYKFTWSKPIKFINYSNLSISNTQIVLVHLFVLIIACSFIFVRFYSSYNYNKITAFLKERSLPINLSELDEWYEKVPDQENSGLKYWELIMEYDKLFPVAMKKYDEYYDSLDIPEECKRIKDYPLSYRELKYDKPFPQISFTLAKAYYNIVSANTNTRLKEIAQLNLTKSRYPIDLKLGYNILLPHLAAIRALTRDLTAEALIHAIEGDRNEMFRSLYACFPLYNSLKDEPVVISQLVRIACFGIVEEMLEWIVNHEELSEVELIELENIVQQYALQVNEGSMFQKGLYAEFIYLLDTTSKPTKYLNTLLQEAQAHNKVYSRIFRIDYGWGREILYTWLPIFDFVLSRSTDQTMGLLYSLVLSDYLDKSIHARSLYFPEKYKYEFFLGSEDSSQDSMDLFDIVEMQLISPTFIIQYAADSRIIQAEIRHYTYIILTQTALAIERFRLSHQRLPENLDELVPNYIPSVPIDPWLPNRLIKYIKEKDGGFKVYSGGLNMKDDGGIQAEHIFEGDLVFEILPLSQRLLPDVSDEILPNCAEK